MKKADSKTCKTDLNKREQKINSILDKIENFAGEVQMQRSNSKKATKSLKVITEKLKSLSCRKSPDFNKDSPYLAGKIYLIKNSKAHLEKIKAEKLVKTLDNQLNGNHEFITAEVMKNHHIVKAIKSRKRDFAFKTQKTTSNLCKPDSNRELIDERKFKILNRILSNPSKLKNIDLAQENRSNFRSNTIKKLTPVSLSPTLTRFLSSDLDDEDLEINYFKTLEKEERKSDLNKYRLSKLLSFKGVFNMAV